MTESFEKAAKDLMELTYRPDHADIVAVYGLYKQATVGDVNTARPSIWDIKAKGKWDAWYAQKGVSKEDAMEEYVKVVKRLKQKS